MKKPHQNALRRGIKDALGAPGLVLSITFFAFGALAKSLGAPLLAALGLTAFVFAIPGQVVLLDELGRDGTMIAAFIATTLTSIRLFPLTMSMLPVLRGRSTTKATEFFVAHFIAVTVWVQSMLALPDIEREQRAEYCIGLVLSLLILTMAATVLGFISAQYLPPSITAVLLMVTPIYFFLSLIDTAKAKRDQLAFLVGGLLGAVLTIAAPATALILSGLVGGTAAYLIARSGDADD